MGRDKTCLTNDVNCLQDWKNYKNLILGLAVGIPLGIVFIFVVVMTIICCKGMVKKSDKREIEVP